MTAEEFISIYNTNNNTEYSNYDVNISFMIEFAKYHVTEALKQASEKAEIKIVKVTGKICLEYEDIDKESIINSYNLKNIK